jgi:hypothetical protein
MKPSAPFPKRWSEEVFRRLALELFESQKKNNPVYAAYCRQSGAAHVRRWQDIPALPVSAFKFHRIACFPKARTIRTFMTSGTTRGALRGKHEYAELRTYDRTVRALFKKFVLPAGGKLPVVFLVQPPSERPESSLSHMGACVQRFFGKGKAFHSLGKDGLKAKALVRHLQKMEKARRPVLIFTTTFALADFLDHLAARKIKVKLPHGSRILETGGYKGRRTEVARPELVKRAGERLGIPATHIVNEYGMTELTSQFYDRSLLTGRAASVKGAAPWTRVLIIDQRTGRPVPRGKRGMIRVIDLANRGSCLAVQTEDEGRLVPGGFEILGRRKGADLRGCSLTFEEMKDLSSSKNRGSSA